MLGVDEHRYVCFAQQARGRLDNYVPLRSEFAVTAAYTRMVRGFGGHPKFSKSIPGSALDVTTSPEDARRLLALHAHCRDAGSAWQRAMAEFADYVIELISIWPR